jgi:hypothetical protein
MRLWKSYFIASSIALALPAFAGAADICSAVGVVPVAPVEAPRQMLKPGEHIEAVTEYVVPKAAPTARSASTAASAIPATS